MTDTKNQKQELVDRTSYKKILDFHEDLVLKLAKGIPFGLTKFPLMIRLASPADGSAGLTRLIKETKPDGLLLVFGIEKEEEGENPACEKFTVSFLGYNNTADGKIKIHDDHVNGKIDGEETWPPSVITFFGKVPLNSAADILPEVVTS